jgi:hypothetical protein
VHRYEELVANWTADDERVIRKALTRHAVDDPFRAMYEALVLPEVIAEFGEAAERYEMPETTSTPALEQSLAHYARDGTIRRTVVRQL